MIYTLDTDTCIALLRNASQRAAQQMALHFPEVTITAVVAAELLFGAEKSAHPAANIAAVERFLAPLPCLMFDRSAARPYAIIRTALERSGQIIGGNDMLIAATAMANRVVLVTHNVREFSRITALVIEDWLAPTPQAP